MTPTQNAVNLLKSHADTFVEGFEGDRLTAYRDQRGIWTIGYGATGPDIREGVVWTQMQADIALHQKLISVGENIITLVTVQLNQNEFDALSSFDYNIGDSSFHKTDTLRFLNQGNRSAAADAMLCWSHTGGQVNAGLLRRRQAERKLFLTPVHG